MREVLDNCPADHRVEVWVNDPTGMPIGVVYFVYYDELPSEEELQLARQQNHGSELIGILGDRQEGAFGESFLS